MCGISGIFGEGWQSSHLQAMIAAQTHRGPDGSGIYLDPSGSAGLGHNRLKIIDLSDAGSQPMSSRDGRLKIAFNGEIYNYRELRAALPDYPYTSQSDTEVILAAFERWGEACLDRLFGMFAFLIWDEDERRLFAARDRFGVKPLTYHLRRDGTLFVASEARALFAAGIEPVPDTGTWSTYLGFGVHDHTDRTFWQGIRSLPAGHTLTWHDSTLKIASWYEVETRVGLDLDHRPVDTVEEEYSALLAESVRLRFRSDVPVGINLSGGLDSSLLLGLVDAVGGAADDVNAFTFVTGDSRYDELPWVEQMLAATRHASVVCRLEVDDVPGLARSVAQYQDAPFGGIPTLAYARVFEEARARGVIVLLDGQGMDEQWAGYDYYDSSSSAASLVQGTKESSVRPECLAPEFRELAEPFAPARPFPDSLRNLQLRDVRWSKIPKALRFNDRISMRASTELREPFLDHRLVELAFRQPPDRKCRDGVRKWLARRIARTLLPVGLTEAPKRPLQTPQREWLRGELRDWASSQIDQALAGWGASWLEPKATRAAWRSYCEGAGDNSFYVWQWISLGLMSQPRDVPRPLDKPLPVVLANRSQPSGVTYV